MKVLNDAEFLLLYDLYSPQNLDLPCDLYPHFDLQNLTEDECMAEFRFRKTNIPRLSQALRIPDVIICHQGTICEGTEGLCMLLNHLDSNSIQVHYQHSFRQRHSCETQLTTVIESVARNLDLGQQSDLLLLDFAKAFDTVPRQQLLKTLDNAWTMADHPTSKSAC